MPEEILLGYGIFSVGAVDIALTRGGGKFLVERTYREIQADGDFGPVKGRIKKDRSVCSLSLMALEMLEANLPIMYPATELDTTTVPGTGTLSAKEDIEEADYNDTAKFTGKTLSGKDIVIEIEDAINLGNIDWALIDKDEVVPEIVYTGTYDPAARTTEPWHIDYVTPA